MGRWGRSSKPRGDENGGRGGKDDRESMAPLQLVTNCEPEAMVAQLRGGEEGLDRLGADGWGCLHHAASLGMRGHVEALLDAKANALLKTAAPSGSFAKGLTALQVAQSVHKAGRGDRTQVIEILQLGVQANGWGDWRALKASDGQRQAHMASKATLPASSARPNPVTSSAGMQATVSAVSMAKLEEAVAAAEDRVRWAMRDELASRESATRLVEMELLEARERESGYQHKMRLMEEQLDATAARERDAKTAATVASQAKDAAEKGAAAAEARATKETVARRRAVAAAKGAQTQADEARERAEAAEAECTRMATVLELTERARSDAEAARGEAELAMQRQAEQLEAMAFGASGDTREESTEHESDGPLQQIMAQVTELKERCKILTTHLEAATAARVAAEMDNTRLETEMHEQAAAAAASAEAAAKQAAKALQEEVQHRLTAEELHLKTAKDLECKMDFERARVAEQLARYQAAQAAQEAEALRSRHGTATKAIAKMVHRGLGRGFCGWLATVRRLQRRRALLQRSAARFAYGAIASAFGSWQAWAKLGTANRSALEQLEKRESDLRAIETVRVALAAQVAELKTELVKTNARHAATVARIQAAAQQESKTLRAAVRTNLLYRPMAYQSALISDDCNHLLSCL